MVIVLDENFNITAVSDATVNQGDSALGRIKVVTPFPNNIALSASFTLPNGAVTPRYPLVGSISATDNTKTVYTLNTPATVFSLKAGSVMVQFFATYPKSDLPFDVQNRQILVNVRSGSQAATTGLYPITPIRLCSTDIVTDTPTLPTDYELANLEIIESDGEYILRGALSSADTVMAVAVSVQYYAPKEAATAATNFTVQKGSLFNLPASVSGLSDSAWNALLSVYNSNIQQILAEIEDIHGIIKTLDVTSESFNVWELDGIYKVISETPATGKLNYTMPDEDEYEEIKLGNTAVRSGLLFVHKYDEEAASFTMLTSYNGKNTILVGTANTVYSLAGYYNLLSEIQGAQIQLTIPANSWNAIPAGANAAPYKWATAVGLDAVDKFVELINDNPVMFAKYGIQIEEVTDDHTIFYAVQAPSTNITVTVKVTRSDYNV